MNAKKILLHAFFVIALLVPSFVAQAYDAASVYIKELNVKQTSFKEGDKINADFLIWNSENEIASGLSYSISLDQNRDVFNKKMYFVSESVYPDKTFKQDFSYPIPKVFPAGDYDLKIQVISQSGISLGWKTIPVSIKGTGSYLNISNISAGSVVQDKKNTDPRVESIFNSNDAPKIKFTVYNSDSKKMDFAPQIAVYSSFENPNAIEQVSGESFSIDPKRAKEIELAMPKYQKPGTYVAKITLMSQNVTVSKEENFIWTIKGVSVKILNVSISNDSLDSGKEVKASIDYNGIADGANVGSAKLGIKLYDGNSDKIIASGEKDITVEPAIKTEVFSLLPKASVGSYRAEIMIVKNGKELASYGVDARKSGVGGSADTGNNLKKNITAIFILLIILVIIFFIMKYYRKGAKVLVLLLMLSGGFFGAKMVYIYASTTYTDDLTLVLTQTSPVLNSVVNYGSTLTFEGSVDTSPIANQMQYVNDLNIINSLCDINQANCVEIENQTKYNVDPSGVAYNTSDNKLYILDEAWYRSRILKVDPATKKVEAVLETGSISSPTDIFYAASYLYVADRWNYQVMRFNPANIAATKQTFNTGGIGDVSFAQPQGVFVYNQYLFVADTDNNRIVKKDLSDSTNTKWESYVPTGSFALSGPSDVTYDPVFGNIYVADTGNNRIIKFKPVDINGTTGAIIPASLGEIVTNGSEVLNGPKSIFYASPYLYVADTLAGRIVRLKMDVSPVSWSILGSIGSGVGEFDSPSGIFYYDANNIYVADTGNNRVVRFKPSDMNGSWNAYDYYVDTYRINTTIPVYFNPGFQLDAGDRGLYAKIELRAIFENGAFKNVSSFTRIKLAASATVTPVICKLYVITDAGTDDSRLRTIDAVTGSVSTVGIYNDYDIENLDIDPISNQIYVATDQATKPGVENGMIYIADAMNGDLATVGRAKINGVTPVNGIVALSFHPDGSLWAWSKEDEQGLIKIEINRITQTLSSVTSILSDSNLDLEGLAWNNGVLYGVAGKKLYKYRPAQNDFDVITNNVVSNGEVEGLDATSDGKLYVGKGGGDRLYIVNIDGTEDSTLDIHDSYDIEGLSWPGGCAGNPPEADPLTFDPPTDYCDLPQYVFKWTFSDPDGDTQANFELQIDNDNVKDANGSFITPTIDRLITDTRNQESVILTGYPSDDQAGSNKLAYNTTYYWQVKVTDSTGRQSDWMPGINFTTAPHRWPIVGFMPPPPDSFTVGIPIHFITDSEPWESMCFDNIVVDGVPYVNAEVPCASFSWDFCYESSTGCTDKLSGEITTSDTYHTYTEASPFNNVVLWVKDSDGNICSNARNPKNLGTKQPKWKEVIPTN